MPHRLIAAHKAHKEAMKHIEGYIKDHRPEMTDQLNETPSGHEPEPKKEPEVKKKHKGMFGG